MVENQPPPLVDYDIFRSDRALREGLEREGAASDAAEASRFGARLGLEATQDLGFQANRNPPELRTHDRFGQRLDEVRFHPAWHEVMRLAMAHQVHNLPWRRPEPGAQVLRSTLHSMLSQVESGSCCPLTMTYACVPALRQEPALFAELENGLLGVEYDPALRTTAAKKSILIGMAMTEKQGGSDVRANSTRARALYGDGRTYELVGHKWFCSAPMS